MIMVKNDCELEQGLYAVKSNEVDRTRSGLKYREAVRNASDILLNAFVVGKMSAVFFVTLYFSC